VAKDIYHRPDRCREEYFYLRGMLTDGVWFAVIAHHGAQRASHSAATPIITPPGCFTPFSAFSSLCWRLLLYACRSQRSTDSLRHTPVSSLRVC